MVGELDPWDVERGGVWRYLVRVVDEDELGVFVEELSNEPGAGGAVDVAVGAGCPFYETTASFAAANSSTACCASSRSGGGK